VEEFLNVAYRPVPLGWLLATSAALLRYMVEKREKKESKRLTC